MQGDVSTHAKSSLCWQSTNNELMSIKNNGKTCLFQLVLDQDLREQVVSDNYKNTSHSHNIVYFQSTAQTLTNL